MKFCFFKYKNKKRQCQSAYASCETRKYGTYSIRQLGSTGDFRACSSPAQVAGLALGRSW